MSYGLSIDVGTSFTAAAVLRTGSQGPEEPRILPLGSRGTSIPTVVFLTTDGHRLVGEIAERRGLAEPANVAREFKRRMGDAVPLVLGGTPILPEELFAVVVEWVVGVATEREGEPPASITLTHPAGWGEHRTSLLQGALAASGFPDVVLMTEPEAAALSYAARERVAQGSTLAVYDLGGGTFDATVVRKADADTFTILGTPQGIERLGGADFDQEVFNRVLEDSGVSFGELEHSSPEVLAALTRLRRECSEAKEALSSDSEATVSIMVPGSHSQVRLVRSEFELMVEPALRETLDAMRTALESAGVRAADLSAILLIGGSSRIPLVAQLLSGEFNRPLAIDVDPKASVALGAAFATAALEDDRTQAVPAVPGDADVPAGATGRRRSGVNAAGFAVPTRAGAASSPHHGPAAMATKKRLGLRVGAVAAAVALLGVATATATNAPDLSAAISNWAGDPAAEAAEEPNPAQQTPTPQASDPAAAATGAGVGPLAGIASAPLQDKLFGVGSGATADGAAGAAGTPSSSPDRARRSASTASDDVPKGRPTPGVTPEPRSGAGAAPAPSPSSPSSSPSSPSRPGTTPGNPSPPVPFPSPDPTAPPTTPADPVPPTTDPTVPPTVPPVVPPTTPPTTDPTVPPIIPPVVPPTTPPVPPTEPPPPPVEPTATATPGPPAPVDPPPPGEGAAAQSTIPES